MNLIQKTIGECLKERVELTPDRRAIIYGNDEYTWSEVEWITDCMAMNMCSYGITKGTHVGIWSVNTPNWINIFLALQKIGAIPVVINTCYKEKELMDIIRYSDIEYLYYGEGFKDIEYKKIIYNIKENKNIKVKKWIEIKKIQVDKYLKDRTLVTREDKNLEAAILEGLSKKVKPTDTAVILFTSGTTSSPKGVMLTHVNIVNSAIATLKAMEWTEKDIVCIAVPLFHCFGITSGLLTSIIKGCTSCLLSYYKTIDVLSCIERYRCTVLNGVPSMFLAMIHNKRFDEFDISSLRSGIIAGSPFSLKEYLRICERIPRMNLIPSYGQTETSPAISFGLISDEKEKKGSNSGIVIEDVEIRIVDVKSGDVFDCDKTGEIMIRGYNVMQGYYNLTKETEATITPDGWLHTGDLGYLDEEGYLHINGRCKDIIIRAGENISPCEIESCLKEIEGIVQAKVLGIPAEVIQEEIVACIVLGPNIEIKDRDIKEYLEGRLAHYKVPAQIIIFEKLPLNASGKIITCKLREKVIEYLNETNRRN